MHITSKMTIVFIVLYIFLGYCLSSQRGMQHQWVQMHQRSVPSSLHALRRPSRLSRPIRRGEMHQATRLHDQAALSSKQRVSGAGVGLWRRPGLQGWHWWEGRGVAVNESQSSHLQYISTFFFTGIGSIQTSWMMSGNMNVTVKDWERHTTHLKQMGHKPKIHGVPVVIIGKWCWFI